MNANVHDEIREIIATGGEENLSAERESWLRGHLRECPGCRDYAAMFSLVVGALRAEPLITDPELVRRTQESVHARALELRGQQERNRVAIFACIFVTLSCALSLPVFWQIAEWVGHRVGVSNLVWQMGFGFFWITPVLAASALLMARNVCWGGWDRNSQR